MRSALAALFATLTFPLAAVAQDPVDPAEPIDAVEEEEEPVFAEQGSFEAGGTMSLSYLDEVFDFRAGPSIGWFFVDRWEISGLLSVAYTSVKRPDGSSAGSAAAEILIEPSYHHPIQLEHLYVFGGIGVGFIHDGTDPHFEIVPRAGFNIAVGRSGFLNPALKVPIEMGNVTNPDGDDAEFEVIAGLTLELSYTTTF